MRLDLPAESLRELKDIRLRRRYARSWSRELEDAFRADQRSSYRIPRAVLFLVHAASYGMAPIYGEHIFHFNADYRAQFFYALALIGGFLLLVAAAVYAKTSSKVVAVLQAAGVCVAGLLPVILLYLATKGVLEYSIVIVCASVMSLLLFGGYARRRMLLGGVVCFSLSALIVSGSESIYLTDTHARTYGVFLLAGASLLAAYTIDAITRTAWIHSRYASLTAHVDSLTGLGNRAEFNRLFESRFAQAKREQRTIALLLLDVDRFKQLNDTHGHLAGDEVLRLIGEAIVSRYARRPLDLRIRYGGEELFMLWYDIHQPDAEAQANQVLDDVRAIRVRPPDASADITVTASAGMVVIDPGFEGSGMSAVGEADRLLYKAKQTGRNRLVSEALQ